MKDLKTSYHQLYVYSDIASYNGDLHWRPDSTSFESCAIETNKVSSHQEFLNLHYVPVAKSFIDQVHISVKGYDVPFITRKSLFKLHFKEKFKKKKMTQYILTYRDNMVMG